MAFAAVHASSRVGKDSRLIPSSFVQKKVCDTTTILSVQLYITGFNITLTKNISAANNMIHCTSKQ